MTESSRAPTGIIDREAPKPFKPVSFSIRDGEVITSESLKMERELTRLRGEVKSLEKTKDVLCFAYPAIQNLSDQLWLAGAKSEDLCGIAWLLGVIAEKLKYAYENPGDDDQDKENRG